VASTRLSRRRFLKMAGLSVAGAGVLGAGYARGVEPGWVDVEHVEVSIAGLARVFDGYRVVQIGDVHADGWMTPERLSEAVRLVNAERPDLVAFTGDLVTADDFSDVPAAEVTPRLVGPLRGVRARDGAVAVLGNHDHWADADLVRRVLGDAGFREVANRHFSVRRDGDALHFAGVDDVMEGRDRLGAVLDGLPGEGAAVLLAHEPDFADTSAESGRFGLQLSGHSHGGQVRVPGVGPPVLPPLGEKYPAGRYEVGGMVQYTNRGLGVIQPRIRFGCRPEITTFVFRTRTG
jgi:uncharacterized protein